jgi:CubicO group peptidase (beta-lactamase class C family)
MSQFGAATGLLEPPAPTLAALDPPQFAASVDRAVGDWLAETGAPSASIAIVTDGKLAYARGYGAARINPGHAATTATRYKIASVSKQFTAAAILLLAEQKKLGLDDKVGSWAPEARAASQATIRQLLTHTSGLRDYYPQDFLTDEMARPTTPAAIIAKWAGGAPDFAPGTQWQYSNTGYVIAGTIIEKACGQSLNSFLTRNIFDRLQMTSVVDADQNSLAPPDAAGYTRHGLGPAHPAPSEGPGWTYASCSFAMTPADLALWDISLINQSLLEPASYKAALTRGTMAGGRSTEAALGGLQIRGDNGRRQVGHDGSVSGFRAENRIWPDDKAAIVVVTNNDWADPAELLARLAFLTVPPGPLEARARQVFAGFQEGTIDRSLFSDNANAYFTSRALEDLKASLAPLGPPRLFRFAGAQNRGGMVRRGWTILCREGKLTAVERTLADGKLEQFQIYRAPD